MILGNAPFIAEPYFGHRSRLYDLDLHRNPDAIADIIIESYNHGVRAINLVNDDALIKGFDMALDEGCDMKVVATVGKSDVDYMNPNYDVAKEVDWEDDIELFDNYDCPLMLVDEFIVDGYDWNLTSNILSQINDTSAASGLITAFPNKTTDLLMDNPVLDLFDYIFSHLFKELIFIEGKVASLAYADLNTYQFLDNPQHVALALRSAISDDEVTKISVAESTEEALENVTVMSHKFLIPYRGTALMHVIGPIEMDYRRMVSLVNVISRVLVMKLTDYYRYLNSNHYEVFLSRNVLKNIERGECLD